MNSRIVLWSFLLAQALMVIVDQQHAFGQAGQGQVRKRLVPFAPLPVEHQRYIDQLLNYWETSSATIQKFRCQFIRWEHDALFGPRVKAKSVAKGIIRFEPPDKAMFEVQQIYDYRAPDPQVQEQESQEYVKRDDDILEKWVCDGNSVFEFDFKNKKLIERPLPPDLRGKSIAEGPLPFLFGAKAATIKKRYWLQVVTPNGAEGEYHLEAWPLRQNDRGNFKFAVIVLDQKDFLPKVVKLFPPGYDPRKNPSHTDFAFQDRQINPFELKDLDKLKLFHRSFHRPKKPSGWAKETQKLYDSQPVAPAQARLDPSRRFVAPGNRR